MDNRTLEEKIRLATCRVDLRGDQLGSCFWVDDEHLITAAHVVSQSFGEKVSVQTADGSCLEAKIEHCDLHSDNDPGTDLALLNASETPDNYETLSIKSTIPKIGSDVLWSGYARLIGESKMERQRFGWGHVASNSYGNQNGEFFEVDGLFNPSHSGGPVVEANTKQVVGVVSASAGGFRNINDEWTKQVDTLRGFFDIAKKDGGTIQIGYIFEDVDSALEEKSKLEDLGLQIQVSSEGKDGASLYVDLEELMLKTAQVQADLSKLLLDTAQSTFQMGIGIVSGGDSLAELMP